MVWNGKEEEKKKKKLKNETFCVFLLTCAILR